MRAGLSGLTLMLVWFTGLAFADSHPDTSMNRVSFQVKTSREVPNDRVKAVLAATDDDTDLARLSNRINQTMSWANGLAGAEQRVTSRSGGYRTYPVQEKGKIRRWHGSQEIVIESGDTRVVSALVGRLQEKMRVVSIDFSVSPESRRKVEEALTVGALSAFRQRAEVIRSALAGTGYEIVKISIQAGGAIARPMAVRSISSMTAESVAPPALQSGTSTVTVNVSGTIELDF